MDSPPLSDRMQRWLQHRTEHAAALKAAEAERAVAEATLQPVINKTSRALQRSVGDRLLWVCRHTRISAL
jgi:hypothetical protein